MSDDKPTDAEEIFSEFQKKKLEEEKPAETTSEPEPTSEPTSEPTPEPEKDTSPKTQEHPIEASETTDNDKERIRDVIFVGTKPIMTYVWLSSTAFVSSRISKILSNRSFKILVVGLSVVLVYFGITFLIDAFV